MEVKLTAEEKQELELQHKKERDRKKAYRMNVLLLRSEGWSQRKIAEALRISEDAVYDYLKAYIYPSEMKLPDLNDLKVIINSTFHFIFYINPLVFKEAHYLFFKFTSCFKKSIIPDIFVHNLP